MAIQNLLELGIGQQCRKERALRLQRRLGFSRADGFIREQQGEIDAMVFLLFRGDGQTPGVRPLCFALCLEVLPASQRRHQQDRDQSNLGAARDIFLGLGSLFLLLGDSLGVADPPLLLLFLGGLAGLLRRAAGVQVSLFDRRFGQDKARIRQQRLGILQAAVAMDQQIIAPAALVPLLGGALNAFEQAQLVLVLGGQPPSSGQVRNSASCATSMVSRPWGSRSVTRRRASTKRRSNGRARRGRSSNKARRRA